MQPLWTNATFTIKPETYDSQGKIITYGGYQFRLLDNKKRKCWDLFPPNSEDALCCSLYHRTSEEEIRKDSLNEWVMGYVKLLEEDHDARS